MTGSLQSFRAVRERYALKRRIERRLLASQRLGAPSRFPEPSCKALLELCEAIEALEPGLQLMLQTHIASPAVQRQLRALWRRVHDENREQLRFAQAWLRGGVFEPDELRRIAASIGRERRAWRAFARDFEPRLRALVRPQSIGHGEVARALALDGGSLAVRLHPQSGEPLPLVYKRLACFASRERAEACLSLHRRYCRLLDAAGIELPWTRERLIARPPDGWQVVIVQQRLPAGWVATEALRVLDVAGCVALTRRIWEKLIALWRANERRAADAPHLALDPQITNWAIEGFEPRRPVLAGDERLFYFDTSTPFLLRDGRPLVDAHLLLHRVPGWLARRFEPLVLRGFAKYHDLRTVLVDYVANCGVQHRPDLQPPLVELANAMRDGELGRWVTRPLSLEGVRRYQRADVRSFKLLRSLARIGDAGAELRAGRNPHPVRTARELYAIVSQPLF